MTNLWINNHLDIRYYIGNGILEYVCGLPQGEAWKIRGMKGHSPEDFRKFNLEREKLVNERMKDKQVQNKLTDFIKETLFVFNALIGEKKNKIKQYLDKEFYFILGAPRSGGTFLFRNIADSVHFPWEKLLQKMIHDNIPNGFFMRDKGEDINALGWRSPKKHLNVLFQISQMLVYFQREVADKPVVVKNISFCYAVRLLDSIFEENAQYIVSIRHPGGVSLSRSKGYGVENNQTEKESDFHIWYTLYHEVVRDGLPKGKIIPLLFGDEMNNFLKDFYKKHSPDIEPEKLSLFNREYDTDFWNKEEFREKMDYLVSLWDIKGLKFPKITEIL